MISSVSSSFMEMADSWERVSSEKVADCRVFRVRRDLCKRSSDGSTSDFYVIESPDWVNVIALTKTGEVVMIEQFRQGTCELNLEIPGGIVDEGESPEAAARRELTEETGYTSSNWVLIGRSRPNPALQNNTMYHFLAVDCEKSEATSLDPNESIVTSLLTREAAEQAIIDGTVSHSLVAAAFFYLSRFDMKNASIAE